MITVTDIASEQLKNVMDSQNLKDVAVRVFVRSQCGCGNTNYGMGFDDTISESDEVVDAQGVKLILDKELAPTLEGATIDFVENAMSRGFSIVNPNAKGCSCGGH